jgi:TPR repeat protein
MVRIFARLAAITMALAAPSAAALAQPDTCHALATRDNNRFALVAEPDRTSRARAVLEACKALPTRSMEQLFALATAQVLAGQIDAARPILDEIVAKGHLGAMRLLADVLARGARAGGSDFDRAQALYQTLISSGDTEAAEGLGLLLWTRDANNEEGRKQILALFESAERAGSASAAMRLGMLLTQGSSDQLLHRAGIEALERGVARGNVRAKTALAEILQWGIPTERNWNRSMELYSSAAESRDAEAQYRAGWFWYSGWPTNSNTWRRDTDTALTYYQKAAAQGHVQALVEWGSILAYGLGGRLSPEEGRLELQQAVQLGSTEAAQRLALLYELGFKTPVDIDKARELNGIAAKAGMWLANIAVNRLAPPNIEAWKLEEQRLQALESAIEPFPPNKLPARHFLRGMDRSDLFLETFRRMHVTLIDHAGRRVFDEELRSGERVNLDPVRPEFISLARDFARWHGPKPVVGSVFEKGAELLKIRSSRSRDRVIAVRIRGEETTPQPVIARDSGYTVEVFTGTNESVLLHDPDFETPARGLDEEDRVPSARAIP